MTQTPEEVFFRYAYPCTSDLLALDMITQEKFKEITDLFKQGETPDRGFLEEAYPNAVKRIKRIAQELGKPYWTEEVIRHYFINHHNKVIDGGEGPYGKPYYTPKLKELCKVHIGQIKEKRIKNGTTIYHVNYNNSQTTIIGNLVPDADIGDKVSIHFRFAIEKL